MGKRICVFGSSIGWGAYDKEGGWVQRLWKDDLFGENYQGVYNLSVDGAMSQDVVTRFEFECKSRNISIAIIAIGMNDSTFDKNTNKCRISLKDTKKNMEQLVSTTKKNGSTIIFIGLTSVTEKLVSPVPWATHLSYSNANIKKYDNVIKKVANDNNVPYCYMYDLLQDEDLDDGLHPNAQGHKKMFERIRDFLVENKVV